MSDPAQSPRRLEPGARKAFFLGTATAGIAVFWFSDHALHSSHSSMEDAFVEFLNPILAVVGTLWMIAMAALQSALLSVSYSELKYYKPDLVVAKPSSGFWPASGFLYNAVFFPLFMGLLHSAFRGSHNPFFRGTGPLFFSGVIFLGAGPLVLLSPVWLRVPCAKLGTKLSQPARKLCPTFFKLIEK